jgi:phosphoglycolate phosphatase
MSLPNGARYRAILFDLDGTLIDGIEDIEAAANFMLAEHGLPAIDRTTIQSFVGNGMDVLVARCHAFHGVTLPDLGPRIRLFKAIYQAQGHKRTRLYPGAAAALKTLTGAGYRLAVCTNKDEGASRSILEEMGIAPFFDAVVGGDTLSVNKPDPRMLVAAAAGCSAIPTQVLYIGDSEVDAELCRRACVPFLLFTEGYRKSPPEALDPTALFSDFTDLPAIIDGLGA